MNKTLVKFSELDRENFVAKCAEIAFIAEVEKIKAAEDAATGTFRVIISTEDRDRQGEIVSMSGWDLTFYKMNPVVLWAHDYWSQPIAVCTNVAVETIAGKQCLVAEGKFAPTDEGQQIRKLYDGKFLTTTSVGFIPKKWDQESGTITEQELLEFSFVPVPANPYAVSLAFAKEIGLNLPMLAKKGIQFTLTAEVKNADAKAVDEDGDGDADQIGDKCELDDGTPGILAEDPKNPKGPLVCVPDEEKSAAKKDPQDGDGSGDTGDGDDDGDGTDPMNTDPYDLDPEQKELIKGLVKEMGTEHNRHLKTLKKATDDMEEKMGELADQQDGKSAAVAKNDAIDQYRKKMAIEHEKHVKCMKECVGNYAEKLVKAMAGTDGGADGGNNDGKAVLSKEMKEKLTAVVKTITEAIALKTEGEGKDHADDAAADTTSDEGGESDDASKGAPNNGSKNGKITDMDEFIKGREIVRTIHEAATRALQNYNKRGKEKARGK